MTGRVTIVGLGPAGADLVTPATRAETIETLLRNCATDPSKSYVANNASELIAAFDSIAKQLAQLRIVK